MTVDLRIAAHTSGLQRFKFLGHVLECGQDFPHAHERAHHGNVDERRTMASEDARKHATPANLIVFRQTIECCLDFALRVEISVLPVYLNAFFVSFPGFFYPPHV